MADVFVVYYFSYCVCQCNIKKVAKNNNNNNKTRKNKKMRKFFLPPVKSWWYFVEIRGFERRATVWPVERWLLYQIVLYFTRLISNSTPNYLCPLPKLLFYDLLFKYFRSASCISIGPVRTKCTRVILCKVIVWSRLKWVKSRRAQYGNSRGRVVHAYKIEKSLLSAGKVNV